MDDIDERHDDDHLLGIGLVTIAKEYYILIPPGGHKASSRSEDAWNSFQKPQPDDGAVLPETPEDRRPLYCLWVGDQALSREMQQPMSAI
jgi:hypothetical protein